MMFCVGVCIVLVSFTNALTLTFRSPTTKNGYIFPNRPADEKMVNFVVEGEDIIFRLAKVPNKFDKCLITTNDAMSTYSLKPNLNDRIVYWDPNMKNDGCGARIKNVKIEDSGRWRLQAINSVNNMSYHSFLVLKVTKNFEIENKDFYLEEGLPGKLNLIQLANYCEIDTPLLYNEFSIVDKCEVQVNIAKKMISGKWKENVGMYGKVAEISMESNVTIIGEYFDVGHNFSGHKINLYCNLQNAIENTTFSFCRFIKQGNSSGLRMYDGLSNGAYSYYGNGLHIGDCGLTIENPNMNEYTSWKCSLGFYRNNNEKYEVKESFISLEKSRKLPYRHSDVKEIVSAIGYPLTVSCNSDIPLRYCIITHPNKTFYSINRKVNNSYWESFQNLDVGICGITIFNTSINENGAWQCQMGINKENQMDAIVKIQVRVAETALVASQASVITSIGSQLTIKCEVVSMDKYLDYCRFTMPDGNGFSIGDKQNRLINDLYWYNGTSLATGDCQVTVSNVNMNHIGTWICAGEVRDSKELESYDFIYVTLLEDSTLSVASISGIVIGPIVLLAIVAAGIIYRKRQKMRKENNNLTARTSTSSEIAVFDREATDNLDISIEHATQPEHRSTSENIEMTEFPVHDHDNIDIDIEPDLQPESSTYENIEMTEFPVHDHDNIDIDIEPDLQTKNSISENIDMTEFPVHDDDNVDIDIELDLQPECSTSENIEMTEFQVCAGTQHPSSNESNN